jgi:threonine dehydrogenase-like Zn-dependent dehydrogenase
MKAIAVHPGQAGSIHLRDIPEPQVTAIPDGRGVKVKVLRAAVDGTDKEINAAEYGAAPPGDDYLVTGHESFGQVVEVGPSVPSTIRPGTGIHARAQGAPRSTTSRRRTTRSRLSARA